MNYVGVDLHKETSWFYILDAKGKKLDSKNLTNNPENLKKYFERIPKPFTLAVRNSRDAYPIHRIKSMNPRASSGLN